MSLQQLYTTLNTAIQALSPGQPLQVSYTQVADDNFYYMLLLLKQTNLTVYKPVLTWENNNTQLNLTGELLIYNSSSADFKLAFTEDENSQLVSNVNGTLPSLGIADLISLQLIAPGTDSVSYMPDLVFTGVLLAAASDTLAMSLTATQHNSGWSILGLSLFPLTDIGYIYTATIVAGAPESLPQFFVTGTFQLGQTTIVLTVQVPVSDMDAQGQWLLNFSLPKPLNNTFEDLSNLLFFNNLNDSVPSQILSMPPGKDDTGIFLDQLQILFSVSNRSIQYLNIFVSARGEWDLGPVKLTYSDLMLGFTPGNTSSGMSLAILFDLTMVFGSLDPLTLSLSIPSIKDNWTVSLTSDGTMNSMDDIQNVPGSVSKDKFHFPKAINDASSGLSLQDFTAVFNPFAKTWEQVNIEIKYEGQWYILPSFLEVKKIDLLVNVANNSDGSGVDITGFFTTDIFLGDQNGFDLNIYVEKRADSWYFSASAENIYLTQIIKELLGNDFTLPAYIPAITVDYLTLSIDTGTNTYTGAGKISMQWPVRIAGDDYKLTASVETQITSVRGTTPINSGFVQGIISIPDAPGFNNAQLMLTYTFGKDDVYTASFMGASISFVASTGLINLNLGDHTLGDMVSKIISWAEPNSSATLEAPWDILNDISLKDLNFFFNIKDKSFGFEYKPGNGIDLGIVTINGIGLKYVKVNGKYQVQMILDGQLFGNPIPSWDLLDPGSAPQVPGNGDSNFDLDFLALGQRVGLRDTTKIDNLDQAIKAYKAAFEEPTDPDKVPINDQSPIVFNANANWLIGARFIVMNTVDIGIIFNDPELYGLLIKLSGEKAKIFAGLEFQIIYKKVSDTIGVYEIELKLPDLMRHLEFGAVSVTLPIIGLQIYTNGNFKIDVGFPWNGDFTRSFSVQAFPFIGSGGFYFAWLSSETATSVPRITSGNFKPVIEFGIGVSLGLGKTIDEGVLSGGLSVTVIGILQGVIGFYNPNPLPNGSPAVSGANYYAIQGTLSIVGHVYGSIDFAIIKASLDITVFITARITFICYEPITIFLEAGVSVTLTVSIDLGLFSINIHLSFSATISETFTVGTASTPPWTLAQQQDKRLLVNHHALLTQINSLTPPHKIVMSWVPLQYNQGVLKPVLNIYFVPSLTVTLDDSTQTPSQLAQYMTMLYLDSSDPTVKPPAPSSFSNLVKGLIVWAINANTTDKTWTTAIFSEVVTQKVDIQYLQNIYTYLSCQPDISIPVDKINDFLKDGFAVNLIYQTENPANQTLYGSIFPMFPLLKLSAVYNTQPFGDTIDFAGYNTVSGQYQKDITAYFEKMTVSFMNPLEAAQDNCSMYAGTPLPVIADQSMAGFIYQDYFLMMVKAGIGEAIKLMKAYPYQYQGELLSDLATQFGVSAAAIAISNKSIILSKALALTLSGGSYITQGSVNLYTLAHTYSVTVTDIINLNRTDKNIIQEKITISFTDGSKTYTTAKGDSFQDIANHLTLNVSVDPLCGSIPDLVALTDISSNTQLLEAQQVVLVSPPRYPVTKDDTIDSIVKKYNPQALAGSMTTYSFCALNAITSGLLIPGAILPLGTDQKYPVSSTDTLLILADKFTAGNLNDLVDKIATLAVLQPLVPAFLPSFIYTTDGIVDSFESVSAQFILSIETVVSNNPTLAKVWADATSLVIANVGALTIDTIITQLETGGAFTNLSGMAARFLLHGLRLPSPQELHEARLSAELLWETSLTTYSLYELTGQRMKLPVLATTDQFSMVLAKDSTTTDWIQFKTITAVGQNMSAPEDTLTIQLTPGDIGKVNTLQADTLNPSVKVLRPQPNYLETGRQYSFSNPVSWQYNATTPLWPGIATGVLPSIWPIPDTLMQAAYSQKKLQPLVKLKVGTHDNPTAPLTTSDVTLYSWALQVNLTVSRVPKDISGTDDQSLANVYQLNSTDEAGLVLLERLILFNQQQTNDILQAVHILYPPNATGNHSGGLQSNGLDITTAFIVKTNFSTESHPGQFMDTVLTADAVVLNSTPKDFIEKVWEASIVQTGGFYLYYAFGTDHAGLPDSLFTNSQIATLQLVITFNTNLQGNTIYDFINAVAIGEHINTGNAVFFAQAEDQPVTYPYGLNDTLAAVCSQYNILVDDLGRALQDNTLVNARVLTITGLQYEVKPGDSLNGIVAYFGVGQTNFLQQLTSANPNLTEPDYAVVWTLVNIPSITFTTATTLPTLTTLQLIAAYYFMDAGILANQVQNVAGLFTGQVSFTDKAIDRAAVIAAGNVAIEMQRKYDTPAVPPTIDDYFSSLYNLLGVSIAANGDFLASGEGLPATNRDLDPNIPGSAALCNFDATNIWQYLKTIPVAAYAKTNGMITDGVIAELLDTNPYRGIGGTAQVSMEWLDLYGNHTKTPFSFPGAYPVGTPGPLNNLPIKVRYSDPLLAIEKWPNLGVNYLYQTKDDQAVLELIFNFDVSKYAVYQPVNPALPVNPSNPDGTTRGEQFTSDMAIAMNNAKTDLQTYRSIYYQIWQQDVSIVINDTVSGALWTLNAAELKQVRSLLNDIYHYLTAIIQAGLVYTYYEVLQDDIKDDNPYETAVYLAGKLSVPDVNNLISVNLGLQHPFSIDGTVDNDYKIIVPSIALPAVQVLSQNCPDNRTDAIFEMNCQFTINRSAALVDDNFADVPGVGSALTTLKPISNSLAYSLAQFDINFDQPGSNQLGLTDFAGYFETAYHKQYPASIYKIATGTPLKEIVTNAKSKQLWVIRFGDRGIQFTITGEPYYYSPAPLADCLLNFSGTKAIPIAPFDPSSGLGTPVNKNFIGINLDTWGSLCLDAIDQLLLPQYAVPAYIVDQNAASEAEKYLPVILSAKESLAKAIVSYKSMDPVNSRFLNILSDPAIDTQYLSEAQEALRQLLLVKLSNAYAIDAVIQFKATVVSAYPNLSQPVAPNLYGQPLANDPATDATAPSQVFSLSPAKIPLTNGSSDLSFTFSTKNKENQKNFMLDLSYQINHIEYDITPVTVTGFAGAEKQDYNASTWLSLVTPLDPVAILVTPTSSTVEIPVPLRTYPTPPSLVSQASSPQKITGPGDKERLNQLLQWQYNYTYSQIEAAQDSINTELQFNVAPTGNVRSLADIPPEELLFAGLAQFNEVYPAILKVFSSQLMQINPASKQTDMDSARIALKAFAGIIKGIADSWEDWQQPTAAQYIDTTIASLYQYLLEEYDYVYEDKSGPKPVTKDVLAIKVSRPQGSGATFDFPVVSIAGFQTNYVEVGKPDYFFTNDQGPLLYADRQKYKERILSYPFTNILTNQNAWAAVSELRNFDLVTGNPTTPSFIYKTPDVRFANVLIPYLDSINYPGLQPINIFLLADPQPTAALPLETILATLFTNLFSVVTTGTQKIKLGIGYNYTLTADTTSNVISLPSYITPPVDFQIPADYQTTTGCSNTPTGNSFVCRSAYFIRKWFTDNDPSVNNAQFSFDLSVYSSLNDSQMPLVRIRNLYLMLTDISNASLPKTESTVIKKKK
ncbi:MAG: hypothetical protein V4450_00030 [Bacteroidota bacterium]